MSEKAFTAHVTELAAWAGFSLHYHSWLSVRSAKGFPDLVLVRPAREGRPGRLIFAELKAAGKEPRPEQTAWLAGLRDDGVEAYLWRVGEDEVIKEILWGERPQAGGGEDAGV